MWFLKAVFNIYGQIVEKEWEDLSKISIVKFLKHLSLGEYLSYCNHQRIEWIFRWRSFVQGASVPLNSDPQQLSR